MCWRTPDTTSHWAASAHPGGSADGMDRHLGSGTDSSATHRGRPPRYLLRDLDAVYGDSLQQARHVSIETVLTPIRFAGTNTTSGRAVRTLRSECLDRSVILDERRWVAPFEFVESCGVERPHRDPALNIPRRAPPAAEPVHSGLFSVTCTRLRASRLSGDRLLRPYGGLPRRSGAPLPAQRIH